MEACRHAVIYLLAFIVKIHNQQQNDNGIFTAKRQEKWKQPTHKTEHLETPSQKPVLQVAKEPFSSNALSDNHTFASKMNSYQQELQ